LAPVLEKGIRHMHRYTPFLLLMTCHTPEAKKMNHLTMVSKQPRIMGSVTGPDPALFLTLRIREQLTKCALFSYPDHGFQIPDKDFESRKESFRMHNTGMKILKFCLYDETSNKYLHVASTHIWRLQ
jgi:hypothetical protein